MTLYLDSLFLINFTMNYFILFLTGKITNQRFGKVVKYKKYIIGSLITTLLYLSVILVKPFRDNFNFAFGVLIISVGVIITFSPKTKKIFLVYLVSTHIVAFSIGGVSFGIFYYTKAGAFIGNTIQATINNASIKLLIAATSISYILIRLVANYIESLKLKKQVVLETRLKVNNEIELSMLVDTGNTLIDPISKLPVVVVYYKNLERVIENSLYLLYEGEDDVMSKAFNLDDTISRKLKIIPFKSVGCSNGLILGLEGIIEFTHENIEYKKSCVLGIVDFEIAKNKDYLGIFNPMLIEEDVYNVEKIVI